MERRAKLFFYSLEVVSYRYLAIMLWEFHLGETFSQPPVIADHVYGVPEGRSSRHQDGNQAPSTKLFSGSPGQAFCRAIVGDAEARVLAGNILIEIHGIIAACCQRVDVVTVIEEMN